MKKHDITEMMPHSAQIHKKNKKVESSRRAAGYPTTEQWDTWRLNNICQ